MTLVIERANTVSFALTFLDNTGAAASAASATLQLAYPGRDRMETELLTLTENVSDSTWDATWDSTKTRNGWVDWHAHAISNTGDDLTQGGRFKVSANAASFQHDELPQGSGSFRDYGGC